MTLNCAGRYVMSTCSDITTKRLKSTMRIGTHNGGFHCDELLACFMLTRLPQYKDADIVRSVTAAPSYYSLLSMSMSIYIALIAQCL